MMDRRIFLATVAGLLATPVAADAQQAGKPFRIGWLGTRVPDAFSERFRELGWVEGNTFVVELRAYEGTERSGERPVAELLARGVDVIYAPGPAAYAAKRATQTTPIVFAAVTDPVASGLVASLSAPGGNLTGISNQGIELNAKRLELLKALAPRATRVGVLINPEHRLASRMRRDIETTARTLGMVPILVEARTSTDLDAAFTEMRLQGAQVVLVTEHLAFYLHRKQIVDLSLHHGLPAMFEFRAYVEAGGLIAYGPDFADVHRRVADLVDKILKGRKPANLPVEQSTKFELVINLKTAKALGLTIPQSLLARADEVIQ
jgi:ABC-type uncharacterized transport system substrate-binding protein